MAPLAIEDDNSGVAATEIAVLVPSLRASRRVILLFIVFLLELATETEAPLSMYIGDLSWPGFIECCKDNVLLAGWAAERCPRPN